MVESGLSEGDLIVVEGTVGAGPSVHSFVKQVAVKPGRAAIIYSIPSPDDSLIGGADAAEVALNGRVMNSVLHGGPGRDRTCDQSVMSRPLYH